MWTKRRDLKLSLEVGIRVNTMRILSHMSLALVENLLVEQQAGSLNVIEAESEKQMKRFPKKVDS